MYLCVIWSLFSMTAAAETRESGRTVRVGCPSQKGLTYRTKQGEFTGYTIDFLEELSNYTEWNYEFVEVEGDLNQQIATLMNMLEKGEIDVLGAMNYREEMEKYFYYPTYHYGISYTALTVSEDTEKWMEEDYANWNGIRVASYPGMEKRLELLEEFARINGFTFQTVNCDSGEDMFRAVEDGRADAVLQVDIAVSEGYRTIARFNPQPFYFVVSKKAPDLFREMNQGLYSLLQATPELQATLYEKYFSYKGDFYLTKENKEHVKSLGTLKVLFFEGNRPIQARNKDIAGGVAGRYFNRLSKDIGLSYVPVFADSYEEGLKLIQRGEVDMVAAVPQDVLLVSEGNLHLSHPYFESYGILVSNGKLTGNEVVSPTQFSANVENDLWKLDGRRGENALLDANCVSFYTRKKGLYNHLHYNWGTATAIRYSIGLVNRKDTALLNILNSYFGNLPKDIRQEIFYESIYDPVQYNTKEFLYVYRWAILIGLVVLSLLYIVYLDQRNAKKLREKALENDRMYQFARLTDECIFEYDYKRDKLNVQNSQEFFPGATVIDNYLKEHRIPGENEYRKKLKTNLNEMLENREEQRDILSKKGNLDYWYRIQVRYIGEKELFAIGRISDVNQEILQKDALQKQAYSDALTGLHNRASVESFISAHLQNKNNTGILLLFDIDNFKQINDTMGHLVGDQVLREFSAMLRKYFRHMDLKARMGGDEFVVFFTNWMPEKDLSEKLKRLIDRLNEEIFVKYTSCNLSVSIGAAYAGEYAHDYESLYRLADNAMYVAKHGGKNDYFVATEEICMSDNCDNCQTNCKKREYLLKKGVLS